MQIKNLKILLPVITIFVSCGLSGCFSLNYEDIHSWYEKQPQSWDDYMEFGNRYTQNGDVDKAVQMYQKAIDKADYLYGPYDIHIAISATAMGDLYVNLGQYAQAEPLLRRSLAIKTKLLGKHSNETLLNEQSLAIVLTKLSRPQEAKKLLDKSH